MLIRSMIRIPAMTLAVIVAAFVLLACWSEPHPTSQFVFEPDGPVFERLPEADADLVNRLIECYETNELIWGATKGMMETRLAAELVGNKPNLEPADMRPFLVDAALAEPEAFRVNGLATLQQCVELNPRNW